VNLQRVDIVARFPGGETSAPFAYDAATRTGIDAVVIVAWHRVGRSRRVYLRTAVRVPLALREGMTTSDANMWEVPAGIIDAGETPRDAAVRELGEELGFDVDPSRLRELGGFTWPSPGLIAERHYYFMIDLTGERQGVPTEDGSPLERAACIVDLPVEELLARCRRGELHDAKTELAIRRFAELP
jgi:ADP-ribose pyrophosphatase